jgi:carboxyl-terminal processing protease
MKKTIGYLCPMVLLSATGSFAEDSPKIKVLNPKTPAAKSAAPAAIAPLFPVALPFEFPNAKAAFEETKKLLLENYYSTSINEETLYWAAIKGMLRQVSPPENREHSKILLPIQGASIDQMLNGKSTSYGLSLSFDPSDGSLTVTDVAAESAADGLIKINDRIMQINKQTFVGKKTEDVLKLLEGKVGDKINLTVVRGIKVMEITLTRKEFAVRSLNVFRLPNQIALIELHRVTHNAAKELKDALVGLEKDGYAKKVIFDLRGNGGGVSSEGVDMADLFLKANELVMMVRTKNPKVDRVVTKDDTELNGKFAVLVNKQTASSSEVLVSALKSYGKAKVFGSNTYGKGIIDRDFILTNKFRVLFPTGVMYSPKGVSWQTRGITPDVQVAQDLKIYNELAKVEPTKRLSNDAPLKAAFEYLN